MKKLYKWDLISYFNQLKWLFVSTLFLSLVSFIAKQFIDDNFIWTFLYQPVYIMSIVGIIALSVYSYFSIFQRYYQTMFKDEAYFTHTLPLSKTRILISKMLSAFTLLIILIMIVGGLLILLEIINIKQFWDLRLIDQNLFNISLFSVLSAILMLFITILVIYAAISFGFSYNKREWLYTFLYFIIYYMVNQFLSLLSMGINLIFNPNLFDSEPDQMFNSLIGIIIVQLIFSIGLGVLNFFISRLLITKKLNLKNG